MGETAISQGSKKCCKMICVSLESMCYLSVKMPLQNRFIQEMKLQ